MRIKNILLVFKIFIRFKNPLTVLRFYLGQFSKGQKIILKPYRGHPFIVARSADRWLVNKVLEGKMFEINNIDGIDYIVEDGFYLRAGTSDTMIFKEIHIDQCYEDAVAGINKNSIVVDLGTQIGLFSLKCSEKAFFVYGYEAHPDNFKLAKKNILSKNVSNVKLKNRAVWSSSGTNINLKINGIDSNQTGEFAVTESSDSENSLSIEVPTISLEDIFVENDISSCDLLKMDIEGAEYKVLFVTPDIVFSKINKICMEYHPDIAGDSTVDELIDFLKKKRYQVKKSEISQISGIIWAERAV